MTTLTFSLRARLLRLPRSRHERSHKQQANKSQRAQQFGRKTRQSATHAQHSKPRVSITKQAKHN